MPILFDPETLNDEPRTFVNRGLLVVISAPSGGGKSTLVRELRKKRDNLGYSISATTRPPRVQEKDGQDYFFITEEEFVRRKKMTPMRYRERYR